MNPLSKLTMYDMLTMLVAGFLWCGGVCLFCWCCIPYQSILFWVISYIVGLVYHRFLDGVVLNCECLRNNPKLIAKAHAKVQAENPEKLTLGSSKTDYYAAYYALAKSNSLGSVPVLEIQAALLRNLILILGTYSFVSCCCGCWIYGMIDCCVWRYLCGVVITLLILWILWLLWRITQYKIHELVWEGYAFLK